MIKDNLYPLFISQETEAPEMPEEEKTAPEGDEPMTEGAEPAPEGDKPMTEGEEETPEGGEETEGE